jgi:hypothetical protein
MKARLALVCLTTAVLFSLHACSSSDNISSPFQPLGNRVATTILFKSNLVKLIYNV